MMKLSEECGMNFYYCTDHDSHWPVGCASVAFAENEDDARTQLDAELALHGLRPYSEVPYKLVLSTMVGPRAIVLCDGNF